MKRILTKLLDLFFLLRFPLLAPVWTIFLVGYITGNEACRIGGVFYNADLYKSVLHAWIILSGFSLVVASIYVVNQIADIESDRINHKLFILPNGFVSIKTAWILASVCALSGLLIALAYSKVLLILFSLSLVLGYCYNLSPVSLKNRPIGGVTANALGHGMIAFLTGWYSVHPFDSFSLPLFIQAVISSLSPSFANGAVFLATTVPDAEGDRSTGKVTFCVKYGEKTTATASAVLCVVALITSFFMLYNAWIMIATSLVSVIFFIYFAFTTKKEYAFRAFKWPVFLLSAAVVLFQPEYGVLIILTFFGSRLYYKWRFNIEYPTFKAQ
ncbi:MAG: UbiA family prenyltransferase [Fibrobacter sp.]|nr:UbiA family prenyltransferase [Fibrobacter sp.]